MIFRKLIIAIFCITCITSATSCSSNDDDNNDTEQSFEENAWMLEGSWKLKSKYSDEDTTISEITFCHDGSGISGNKKLTWYTSDNKLFITFDNGKKLQARYSINGATLEIYGIGIYVTQLPMTGTWYAENAMHEFKGNTFCYYFDENGDGIKYTFDYIGLTAKTTFKWNRLHDGVSIIYHNTTEDKKCFFKENSMNIEGEGTFSSALPFYGKWKAVDSDKGLISEDDDNYSTIDITSKDDKNIFVCSYKNISDEGSQDASFQGSLKFAISHQQFYNDQQLFIIKDVVGGKDAQIIYFRFFYYPPYEKVYLDLSHDVKLRTFVRYELC